LILSSSDSSTGYRARPTVAARSWLPKPFAKYVELNNWQIEETKKALAEAERGDFASDGDVQRTMRKWTRRAR
jgi:predicted transcriptional regulator